MTELISPREGLKSVAAPKLTPRETRVDNGLSS